MNKKNLYYLKLIEQFQNSSRYLITDEFNNQCQFIDFILQSQEIIFIEPFASFLPYLKKNLVYLKKIISISLRAKDQDSINIPFSFEKYNLTSPPPALANHVYTDGSYSPNSQKGGWAAIILGIDRENQEISGFENKSSSNRMELMAVVQGISAISSDYPVVVITDSNYVIHGSEEWLPNWELNGYQTALNQKVKNYDLWQKMSLILKEKEVYFKWIKSSSKDFFHQRCDELAGMMVK